MTAKLFAFLTLAHAAYLTSANAATIIWGSSVTISGDSDVSTSGTSVFAASFDNDGSTVTVNGVNFVGGSSAGVANSSAYTPNLSYSVTSSNGNVYGSASAPFSSLSANYQALLESGIYNNDGTLSETLTLGNLTIGQAYQVQIWINDSRANSNAAGTMTIVGTSTVLDYNTGTSGAGGVNPYAGGGLGQYAIGTFTANATTQSFDLSAQGSSWHLSALQLRAIPEPSTSLLSLGALTGLGMFFRRRRS